MPAPPSAAALPEGVYRLTGLGFDLPRDDLEPLGALVGDRMTVALGESVHTSGGFHLMKARILRYLIEKKGFRVVALETPWGDALRTTR